MTTAHDGTHEEAIVINKLNADAKKAAAKMSRQSARHMVNLYYSMQGLRIRVQSQVRASMENASPNEALLAIFDQQSVVENQARLALDHWTREHIPSQWARGVRGIGPVLAAGLRAHIDMGIARTAGQIFRFAGLDPSIRWDKKAGHYIVPKKFMPTRSTDDVDWTEIFPEAKTTEEAMEILQERTDANGMWYITTRRRPWNNDLKVLCWKIGESFVKAGGWYGDVYRAKKAHLIAQNEAGMFAQAAKEKLENFKIGKETDAYKAYSVGLLPPAHIHSRAKRVAVKMFLSHLHHVWFVYQYARTPPEPFAIAGIDGGAGEWMEVPVGQHAHYILPPDFNEAEAIEVARTLPPEQRCS